MNEQADIHVTPATLPKGGGAIQGIGHGLGAVGSSGTATCEIPLPVSPGRGYAPALALRYSSAQGNGMFGLGWTLSLTTVARRTHLGVPAYTDDDLFVGPSGAVWLPERDKTTGAIQSTHKTCGVGEQQVQHDVVRYRPRIEADFDLIEHWSSATDKPGFWLIHTADGSQHVYGKTPSARRADPDAPVRVAEWLLEESMNAHGEHIVYEYATDKEPNTGPADYRAQRYPSRVRYGNFKADSQLYLCKIDGLKDQQWHFELRFDYDEVNATPDKTPDYRTTPAWSVRGDPFSEFAYGFELGTRYLCRQVLMFHYFPNETSMGKEPVLVRRVLLQYHASAQSYSCLSAALPQSCGKETGSYQPPLEFAYTHFTLKPDADGYKAFDALSSLNHSQRFQFVDLLGEGLPGVLHQTDKSWRYSQPLRDEKGTDHVTYAQWHELPEIPLADSNKPLRQFLGDISGDGRPDWIVMRPGLSGFFTLSPNGKWSNFTSFAAVPAEFFNPQGQLANLMGAGLSDLIMLGPRSVRLYAHQKTARFAPSIEVSRLDDEDDLPVPGNTRGELVAFSDFLGSGQQHLIRIRHNEVKCWPNLGRGRFAKGRVIATLDFTYEAFDASRILLADLDGSGATDLIYLQAEGARIFMNRGGNSLHRGVVLPWPEGLRYDRFCQVSATDLQGLGCSSLVFSLPGEVERHWRYDFVEKKPYLLNTTNNNMGASGSIRYRSSAQEWLDEKEHLLQNNQPAISRLPFAVHLVKKQTQFDEVTDTQLTQRFKYRRGVYDSGERMFQGFGLLQQTDSPSVTGVTKLTKTWFHTGEEIDLVNQDYNHSDASAVPLSPTVLQMSENHELESSLDGLVHNTPARRREFARALNGRPLRVEIYGQDMDPKANHPYSVEQYRYLIRELRSLDKHSPYSIVHPLRAESISYQYERIPDDPRCTHSINLEWDAYGHLTHSLEISYARRKRKQDPSPFTDIWQKKWWGDDHDVAQQFYYVNETKAQFIHVVTPQAWRLGLRYLQRTNALKLPKAPVAGGLEPKAINYENLLQLITSASWNTRKVMTGLSLMRYRKPDTGDTYTDGSASVEALVDHLEIAELNDVALKVYDRLKAPSDSATFDMTRQLEDGGYKKMPIALPPDAEWDKKSKLWSVRRHFATYEKADGFFKVQTFKESQSLGPTAITYDPYYCLTTRVKLPDDCATTASNIDYRTLQPTQITDPNGIVREALYDPFGRVQAVSHYKSIDGEYIGFKPLSTYIRRYEGRPDLAIENPDQALQNVASVWFYNSLSWMGQVEAKNKPEQDVCKQAVTRGDLLPGGHVCASTRTRLSGLKTKKTADEQELQKLIASAQREPVYHAMMQADRYPTDAEKQTRIAVVYQDGFGRQLQIKQKAESGAATIINEESTQKQVKDTAQKSEVNHRWRVSERIEYDSKGLVTRTYRPCFSDRHRYIDNESLHQSKLFDQHFHDPLGRLIRIINANGDERRHTYHPWYSITEDENDTQPDPSTTQGGDV
ncbi:SpvB/TcaC N-terminal domain-containing protein [Pseudomonas sp. LB3P25]